MRRLLSIGLGVLILLCCVSATAHAYVLKLGWDANQELDVIGYRLSYGTSSHRYSQKVDVGSSLQWTVNNLLGGVTYYFAVQAYTASDESDYSSEVQFTVPIVYHRSRLTYDVGSGTWSEPLQDESGATPAAVSGWSTVLPMDFNGDGFTDYFLYNSTTGAWLKAIDNREGSYSFVSSVWASGWTLYAGDFDGDRKTDIFVYNQTSGSWFRCITAGDGRGDFIYTTGRWAPRWQIFPADLNGDGRTDLFLYNGNDTSDPYSGMWFRVLSTPGPDFDYVQGDIRWAPNWQIYPADFNGDRRADLFLYRADGMWFRVSFDRSGGTSYVYGRWATNWGITPGDFNGDGRADLFVYNAATGMWFTVVSVANRGAVDGVDFDYVGPVTWARGWTVRAANLNDDNVTDLVVYNPTSGAWFNVTTYRPGVFDFLQGTAASGVMIVR